MVQQMIVSIFYALSLQGNSQAISSPQFVILGVSNHRQQTIVSAFSTLGLQGNGQIVSSP